MSQEYRKGIFLHLYESLLLFISSSIEQLLSFGQLLNGVVEGSIHVGEVGNTVFNPLNYVVQHSPIDWQCDG